MKKIEEIKKKIKEDKMRCKRCGYTWNKRVNKKPRCCPNCKRYDWDVD